MQQAALAGHQPPYSHPLPHVKASLPPSAHPMWDISTELDRRVKVLEQAAAAQVHFYFQIFFQPSLIFILPES
jgi:hypothetical protein